MEPIISIILPTYNGETYIRESIESCLNQTFSNFELIIVNDCSKDNTASIIEEYASRDERIRVIHNSHNKKLPSSLNVGFEAANGKYFTWTSDDNIYGPEALETMLQNITEDNETDLVYADYTIIDGEGNITGSRQFNNVYDSFFNWLGCGACFLYKAEIHFALNGYNPAAFLIEDYDFFVRAFMKYKFRYLKNPVLYYYREHAASLTTTQSSAIKDISKIFLERQITGLEAVLNKKETALLYRKFAVYFAVQKNDNVKTGYYLNKLYQISGKQAIITALYIPIRKLWLLINVTFKCWQTIFSAAFQKK